MEVAPEPQVNYFPVMFDLAFAPRPKVTGTPSGKPILSGILDHGAAAEAIRVQVSQRLLVEV